MTLGNKGCGAPCEQRKAYLNCLDEGGKKGDLP